MSDSDNGLQFHSYGMDSGTDYGRPWQSFPGQGITEGSFCYLWLQMLDILP